MNIRTATINDIQTILEIVEDARLLIANHNFKQWSKEENYPNKDTFLNDIKNNSLYVITNDKTVLGMMALYYGNDVNYKNIMGKWLTDNKNYLTIHRLAIKKEFYNQGLAKELFTFAIEKANELNTSIRIDTHPKNISMNNLIMRFKFEFCGTINILGSDIEPERNAYELSI